MPRRGQGAAIATRDDERNLSSGISYILLRVLLMTKFRRNRTAVLKTRLNVVTMHRACSVRHAVTVAGPRRAGAGGGARARVRELRETRPGPRTGPARAAAGARATAQPQTAAAARHRHSGRRAPRLTLLPR